MKIIDPYDVQDWYASADDLASSLKSICFQSDELHLPEMPYHLQVAISSIAKDDPAADIPIERFSSISFFSLCKGLFLPLSGLADQRATEIFGFACQSKSIASVQASAQLVETFLNTEVGLTFCQKIGCLLGDPFDGRRSLFRRDSLLRLLQSVSLKTRSDVLDELTKVGDIAIVFAKHASVVKREDPLTAAEVLAALRPMPDLSVTNRFELLRSLLERCGRMEAYYLVKLVLRAAGFGFEYQGQMLAAAIAKQFKVSTESVEHAIALTDPINVANVLSTHGPAGLRAIQLKPLSPVRPALASVSDRRTLFESTTKLTRYTS